MGQGLRGFKMINVFTPDLEPTGVEEELKQGENGHVQIQVNFMFI